MSYVRAFKSYRAAFACSIVAWASFATWNFGFCQESVKTFDTTSAWYPLREGISWEYAVSRPGNSSTKLVNTVVRLVNRDGLDCALIDADLDGEKHEFILGVTAKGIHRIENINGKNIMRPPFILLPIKCGMVNLDGGERRPTATWTNDETVITVPAGEYDAISCTEWHISDGASSVTRTWLSKNIGPVKTELYVDGKLNEKKELVSFHNGKMRLTVAQELRKELALVTPPTTAGSDLIGRWDVVRNGGAKDKARYIRFQSDGTFRSNLTHRFVSTSQGRFTVTSKGQIKLDRPGYLYGKSEAVGTYAIKEDSLVFKVPTEGIDIEFERVDRGKPSSRTPKFIAVSAADELAGEWQSELSSSDGIDAMFIKGTQYNFRIYAISPADGAESEWHLKAYMDQHHVTKKSGDILIKTLENAGGVGAGADFTFCFPDLIPSQLTAIGDQWAFTTKPPKLTLVLDDNDPDVAFATFEPLKIKKAKLHRRRR